MLLKYMIVGGFVWSACCFGMNESEYFIGVVNKTPIQKLAQICKNSKLKGRELDLANKFCRLYVQKTNREEVLRNLKGEDLKEIYVAADSVARSFFAEMRKNYRSLDIAKQTVEWLELLDSDIRTKHIYDGAYPEGFRISDLLDMAREELEERERREERDQKWEEELGELLDEMGLSLKEYI